MPESTMIEPTDANKMQYIDKYVYMEDDASRLGNGAFGVVYRGKHAEDGSPIAIKRINSHKLLSDVKHLFGLRHPNVTIYYTAISEGPFTYIIMELCDTDLAHFLSRNGKLDGKNMDTISKHTAQGYYAIHKNGIIHRDIKTSNILLKMKKTKDGSLQIDQAKITDFGCCRLMTAEISSLAGTPHYMAPEVAATILKPQKYTFAVDMWSIGVVLFESSTGHLPFDESDQCRQILQYSSENFEGYVPPTLGQVVTEMPDYFETVITNLLRLNPAERLTPKQFCDVTSGSTRM